MAYAAISLHAAEIMAPKAIPAILGAMSLVAFRTAAAVRQTMEADAIHSSSV